MKYHVIGGCNKSVLQMKLTRAEFSNTLSNQRCRDCECIVYGEIGARAAAVSRGELIEAREGETMRLTRDGAEVIRKRQEPLPKLLTIEYDPSHILRDGIGQHGSDFMQYFAYVLYGMAADAQHGATQCTAYLKWAEGIERLIKETEI